MLELMKAISVHLAVLLGFSSFLLYKKYLIVAFIHFFLANLKRHQEEQRFSALQDWVNF